MGLRKELTSLALIGAVVLIVYAQTVTYEFQPEDVSYVRMVSAIRGHCSIWKLLAAPLPRRPEVGARYYRPVVLLMFWGDSLWSGNDPSGFHLTNVVLHALTTGVLYWLLRAFGFRAGAAVAALIFAAYPLHVETVCFVSARMEIVTALFAVLCLLFYAKSAEGTPRAATRLVASFGCFVVCILTKESSVTLPAALLAWDLLEPHVAARRGIRRSLPFFVAAIVYAALRLTVLYPLRSGLFARAGSASPIEGLLRAGGLILRAVWRPTNLYVDYPLSLMPPATAVLLFAVSVLVAVLLAPASRTRERRIYVFGWIWAALCLAPVVAAYWGRVSVDIDPYLYLPAVGIVLCVASSLNSIPRRRVATTICLFVAVSEWIGLSLKQCDVWANEAHTYRMKALSAVRSEPGRDLALAVIDAQSGRIRRAKRVAAELSTIPSVARGALHLLAECANVQGDDREAERIYRRMLKTYPDDAAAQLGLASALARQRQFDEATRLAEALLREGRIAFDAALLLGDIREATDDIQGAAQMYARAASMNVPRRIRRRALSRLEAMRRRTGTP